MKLTAKFTNVCLKSHTGSDAITDCLCDAGYRGPAGGPCILCAANNYCPGELVPETPCHPDSSSAAGSSSLQQCLCNNGFQDADESDTCEPCSSSPCSPGLYRTDCTVVALSADLDSVCTLQCSTPGANTTFTWTSGGKSRGLRVEWSKWSIMVVYMLRTY